MKVIQNYVKSHIGVEQFERARIERDTSKQKYLEKKRIYEQKLLLLETEFYKLRSYKERNRTAWAEKNDEGYLL